jgi:hypothetical protein
MDSEKVKQKFFDVTPPQPNQSSGTPVEAAIEQRKIMTEQPEEAEPIVPEKEPEILSAQPKNIIKPLSEAASEETTETPNVDSEKEIDQPADVDVQKVEQEQPAEPEEERTEGTPAPVKEEAYGSIDGLPDPDEKRADEVAEGMESPKIFDTKEYHVPIKETRHGHSLALTFLVGGIFAIVVVGAAVYFLGVFAS